MSLGNICAAAFGGNVFSNGAEDYFYQDDSSYKQTSIKHQAQTSAKHPGQADSEFPQAFLSPEPSCTLHVRWANILV